MQVGGYYHYVHAYYLIFYMKEPDKYDARRISAAYTPLLKGSFEYCTDSSLVLHAHPVCLYIISMWKEK